MATAKKAATPAAKKAVATAQKAIKAAGAEVKVASKPATKKTTAQVKVDTKAAQKVVAKAQKDVAAGKSVSVKAVAKAAIAAVKSEVATKPRAAGAYMQKADRKAQLDAVLLKVLKSKGIKGTTRAAVSEAAGCSNSLLRCYYEGGAAGMLVEGVNLAGAAGDAKIVQKAIADGFPKASLQRKYHSLLK